MMENFPTQANKIDFQDFQEAQRDQKMLDSRKDTPRHIIITLPKIKDKERILKAAKEKETGTYKGVPIRQLIAQKKPCSHERAGKKYSKSLRQGPTPKITLSSKAIIWNGKADKVLPRQSQIKGSHHHRAIII